KRANRKTKKEARPLLEHPEIKTVLELRGWLVLVAVIQILAWPLLFLLGLSFEEAIVQEARTGGVLMQLASQFASFALDNFLLIWVGFLLFALASIYLIAKKDKSLVAQSLLGIFVFILGLFLLVL